MITAAEIREHVVSLADETYREFHSGLVPGEDTILGVRVPVLRSYAKELYREYGTADGAGISALIAEISDTSYEEILLQGMLIGQQKKPELTWLKQQIEAFVPKINNWAVCDIFCGGLKAATRYQTELYAFLQRYLNGETEFEIRFGVVMLLSYYIQEDYLGEIFEWCDRIRHEGYYVKMAVAWLLSICLVKHYQETVAYLSRCDLDDFTYNKALQKGRESYRLSKEQKDALQRMKRPGKRSAR